MTKECYEKRVLEIAKIAFENIAKSKAKEVKAGNPQLFIEFARHGENYFSNNKVKLMVVGRASGKFKKEKVNLAVTEAGAGGYIINEKKIEECFNEYYNEEDNLSWIHRKEGESRYIDSKPFFNFVKKVYKNLTEEDNPEWYKNICYTNICNIISIGGGNPSEKLKKAQLQAGGMLELLKVEIEYYKPTHILVIDSASEDHSWTTKEFKDEVRGYASGKGIKVSFSDRPEIRRHEDLIGVVKKDFEGI